MKTRAILCLVMLAILMAGFVTQASAAKYTYYFPQHWVLGTVEAGATKVDPKGKEIRLSFVGSRETYISGEVDASGRYQLDAVLIPPEGSWEVGSTLEVYVLPFTQAGKITVEAQPVLITSTSNGYDEALPITLEIAKPPGISLSSLLPAPGSIINNTKPLIGAKYGDQSSGVDVSKTKLYLDGKDVTQLATVTATSIAFTSAAVMSYATHVVTLEVTDYVGLSASETWSFTIIGQPSKPMALTQYRTDKTNEAKIGVGGWTNYNLSYARFKISIFDQNPQNILTPEVEVKELGQAFNGTITATGSAVSFKGTTLEATVDVSSLTSGKEYHWRVRLRGLGDLISDWVSFGHNPEDQRDFGSDESGPDFSKFIPTNNSHTNEVASLVIRADYADLPLKKTGINNSGVEAKTASMEVTVTVGKTKTKYQCTASNGIIDITDSYFNWQPGASLVAPGKTGDIDVAVTLKDKAGNQDSGYGTWSFVLDREPPRIAKGLPAAGGLTNIATTTVSAVYEDASPGQIDTYSVYMYINGKDVSPTVSSTKVTYDPDSVYKTLDEGLNMVMVEVRDEAGNSTFKTWSFTVDSTAPQVSSAIPSGSGISVKATLEVTFNEAMNTSSVVLTCNPNPGGWSTKWETGNKKASFFHNDFTLNQIYTCSITGKDAAGNPLSQAYTWSFNTGTKAPPKVVAAPTELKCSLNAAGNRLILDWTAPSAYTGKYDVYRGGVPYFTIEASSRIATNIDDEDATLKGIQWTDPNSGAAINNSKLNYFYAVAVAGSTDASNRAGEFTYELSVPAGKTKYNWLAYVLDTNKSRTPRTTLGTLKSPYGKWVSTIQYWDKNNQLYISNASYAPATGEALRVGVKSPGTWETTGGTGEATFNLIAPAGKTRINWISIPITTPNTKSLGELKKANAGIWETVQYWNKDLQLLISDDSYVPKQGEVIMVGVKKDKSGTWP